MAALSRKRSGVITTFAVLLALMAALWDGRAAQDAPSTLTVVYGNSSELVVQDWHFVYEYLESDTALDPAYVATCTRPSSDANSCMTQVKMSKDLIVLGPLPGPSSAARVPFILPGTGLRAIRIHWEDEPGPYEKDGVRLNPNRDDRRYRSETLTVVTTQGAAIHFTGRLQALETFLSSKKYVYLMKLSVAGSIQVQSTPGRFELRLDERFPPATLQERVDEVQFQPGTDRASVR
jgi:hypothetical protein